MDLFLFKSKCKQAYYLFVSRIFYSHAFFKFGNHSKIVSPLKISNPRSISVGNHVTINGYAFIMGCNNDDKREMPQLVIHDGVTIGHFNHIVALDYVEIGENVLTADHVFISDNNHAYQDINRPVAEQGIYSKGSTIIGRDTWIGENTCIVSARVGKHCVIGANSVVISDIPDYSVAVGNPAMVVKRYNAETECWEKV